MDNNSIEEKNLNGYSIGLNLYKWIINNITLGTNILELGSGAGSYELSKHYNVTSIEQNREYVNKYPGIDYIWAPIDSVSNWYEESCLSLLPDQYSLLVLDGPGGYRRDGIIPYLNSFNFNVPVIVDDVHRSPEANFAFYLADRYKKKMHYIQEHDKSAVILY